MFNQYSTVIFCKNDRILLSIDRVFFLVVKFDFHNLFIEFISLNYRFGFNPELVGIDCTYGVFQNICDGLAILYAQPNQRKNPETGVEDFSFLGDNLIFWLKQGIK